MATDKAALLSAAVKLSECCTASSDRSRLLVLVVVREAEEPEERTVRQESERLCAAIFQCARDGVDHSNGSGGSRHRSW
jgi:hypothetical protein